jgi:pectate lyase
MNQNGTTGGGSATPVVVTTASEFTSNIGGTTARVIHVMGSFSGSFGIGSNKTIIGCAARASPATSAYRARSTSSSAT